MLDSCSRNYQIDYIDFCLNLGLNLHNKAGYVGCVLRVCQPEPPDVSTNEWEVGGRDGGSSSEQVSSLGLQMSVPL